MVAPTNIPVETASLDLSRLVDSARQGGNIVITRAGHPIARIISIDSAPNPVKAGYGKGTVLHMSDDFDAPLAEFDEGR